LFHELVTVAGELGRAGAM